MTEISPAAVKDAQETLSELITQDDTLRCIRCGLCSFNCPTYRAELCESAAPRGRIALLRAVAEDKLDPSELFAHKFFDCVLCAACTAACPGGMEVDKLLLEARRGLHDAGLLPAPLARLSENLKTAHNISGEDNAGRLSWCENMACRPQGADKAQAEVVYFIGCVGSLFPTSYSIPQSFVQALEAGGVDYALLGGEEWCCGYPLLAAGLSADELIAHNLAGVAALGVKHLVATCPSCYKTWKTVYPPAEFDILHATQMLLALMEEGRIAPARPPAIARKPGAAGPLRVTYHDPCDLGRKAGVYDPPRQILARLPGVELVEMANNRALSTCCGGGGNLESLEPELSAAIADRRLAQAQDVGAEVIVTACQQCQRTLSMAARRNKVRLPTMDVGQILLSTLE